MAKLIGIDTGKEGCIAELNLDTKVCRWSPMIWRDDDVLNITLMRHLFDFDNAIYIGFEKVAGNPLHKNVFQWGANYGQCLALIEPYPYDSFSPQSWQRRLHGIKSTSDAKIRTAFAFMRINPKFNVKLAAKVKSGLFDAFCIAYYAGLKNNIVMPTGFEFERVSVDF
jgi:hypothetical protein